MNSQINKYTPHRVRSRKFQSTEPSVPVESGTHHSTSVCMYSCLPSQKLFKSHTLGIFMEVSLCTYDGSFTQSSACLGFLQDGQGSIQVSRKFQDSNQGPLYILLWTGICQKKWSSHYDQQKSLKCSTWMQSQNDRMISVHFQGKPFNITVIQVYALISNAEKAKLNGSMKTYKTFQN